MNPRRVCALSGLVTLVALSACGPSSPPPKGPDPTPIEKSEQTTTTTTTAPDEASSDCLKNEPPREAHGWVAQEGGYYVEHTPDEQRVWEMTSSGVRLRARVAPSDLRFFSGGMLAVRESGAVHVLDLARDKAHVLVGEDVVNATSDYVFLESTDSAHPSGRRARVEDLSSAGLVAWGDVATTMRGEDDSHVLAGGASLAIGDALVSFQQGKVLSRNMLFGAATPDGKRISACDGATRDVVEVDAATGAVLARFRPPKDKLPAEGCATSDTPAYANEHTVFWFEQGAETKDAGRRLIVAAGDTVTGKVTRFADPEQTWSIGFSSYPFVEGGRLCTTIASFHTSMRLCDWVLEKGRVKRSPEGKDDPTARSLGLGKAAHTVLTAKSPSGAKIALLTYTWTGKDEDAKKRDLRLTVATTKGVKEAGAVLFAGQIDMNDERPPQETGEVEDPWAKIVFYDETRVAVFTGPVAVASGADLGAHVSPAWLLDTTKGAATPLCGGGPCYPVGRYVAPGVDGKLVDPLTGQAFSLTPTEAEWQSALRIKKACPRAR